LWLPNSISKPTFSNVCDIALRRSRQIYNPPSICVTPVSVEIVYVLRKIVLLEEIPKNTLVCDKYYSLCFKIKVTL
jgi:hypothetical protein